MGTSTRVPVRLLALVLFMTLLPQVALAQSGPPPRVEITAFECSGHIEAYVPYERSAFSSQDDLFRFQVFTPDRSWSDSVRLYSTGPGVYDAYFRLPSDRDSFVGMIQVPYDNFMLDVDTMTISGCAGASTTPDSGLGHEALVAQIVALLISILTALLG